ncbi:MAG: Flp pilus assembly complex ATPase component TadA [Oligoflexia bacterium]|nr:Flp pilus assembly complex ATPase component TadA [Oligoflexia bacterium]
MFNSSSKPAAVKAKKGMVPRPGGGGVRGDELTVEGNLKMLLDSDESASDALKNLDNAADAAIDAPLIRLVNLLLVEAVKANASDIHIEPFESILRVRFRIDGILQEMQKIPPKLASSVSSRLKIMAELDICERRVPQDGSFKLKSNGVQAEFRMSTLPSAFGEKIVLRVMSSTAVNNDLSKLGIPSAQLKMIRDAIHRPDGLVLVTGPTGSGKTTTLYAALNELNDISVSVFTAEDPIEGTLQGVTQCQANPSVGYTFAAILRSLLRQDPDVILVGEIRDQETAEISIKAALTGHLVLSTLHTNCAVSTIQRLLNMGVAPYLITTSINCVVAQRLVRKVCQHCKQKVRVPTELITKLGVGAEVLTDQSAWHGQGCDKCRNQGYAGRAPIYEVLRLDDQMRSMILAGASKDELKAYAVRSGMVTLRRAGLELVKEGLTSIEEVLGATSEELESVNPDAEPLPSATLRQAVPPPVLTPSAAFEPVQRPNPQPIVNAAAAKVTEAVPLLRKMEQKQPSSSTALQAGIAAAGVSVTGASAPGARWKTSKPKT